MRERDRFRECVGERKREREKETDLDNVCGRKRE